MEKILYFLIPKHKVVYVYDDFTLGEALDKLKDYRFSAVPILNRNENYLGTLSEGDILWFIKSMNYNNLDQIKVSDIPRFRDNLALNINSNTEVLLSRASNGNFVPIIDDDNKFMGIVTRKEIIDYFFERNFIVL